MPVHIPVTDNGVTEKIDVEVICSHPDAYIDKACCSGPDSDGLMSCGCGGQDSIVCPNSKCQGISDDEVDDLFDKLLGNHEEDLT